MYRIGIDIGGTNTALGLVDPEGTIVAEHSFTTVPADNKPQTYTDNIIKAINELIEGKVDTSQIEGIGIGAPAANQYTGMIEQAANLPWLAWTPIGRIIEQATGIHTVLTNDANAAAMGEMFFGAAKGIKNFIMITLGTGIGSGIVVDGKVLLGDDSFAGELGHITIRRDGRDCSCGRKGCLECYASATGVARTARLWLEEREDKSTLRELKPEEITSYDIYKAAKAGDSLAAEIFTFTGEILGEAFADFVHFSSPKAIILFGGLAKSGEMITRPAKEAMERNLLPMFRNKVQVLCSELPEAEAAILGAAASC